MIHFKKKKKKKTLYPICGSRQQRQRNAFGWVVVEVVVEAEADRFVRFGSDSDSEFDSLRPESPVED